MEVHMSDKTIVTISPSDVKDIEVKDKADRKKISDLKESENNVEILGTIVQVFDPRFFEVCPQCNKRAKQKEDGFYCDTHNKVEPSYAYVLNLFLDDGTENVRVVLWRNQVQNLFNMKHEEIIAKKDESFEEIKNELLGQIVKFVGRTNKNEMFDRIEFIPQLVFTNPDPKEEINRLDKELETAKEETVVEDVKPEAEEVVKAQETQSDSVSEKETVLSETQQIEEEPVATETVEETVPEEKVEPIAKTVETPKVVEPSEEDFMPKPMDEVVESLETQSDSVSEKETVLSEKPEETKPESVDISEALIQEIETPEEPSEPKPETKDLEEIDDIEDITDLDSL